MLVTGEAAPADREVSESEAKNATLVDVGAGRPRARLQLAMGIAAVDWWSKGLQVTVTAAGSDRSAALAVARKIVVTSDGSKVSLRAPAVSPRVLIAPGALPKIGFESFSCNAGAGGRTLTIESGGGFDPAGPPIFVGDELSKSKIGPNPAWRTSRTVKMVVQGRDLTVTTCLLSWQLSSNTKATLIGSAPCDPLTADAAALSASLG